MSSNVTPPAFGDVVVNHWASHDNPRRTARFVRVVRRRGRMNPGLSWQVTDGRGSFWEVLPAAFLPTDSPVGPDPTGDSSPTERTTP